MLGQRARARTRLPFGAVRPCLKSSRGCDRYGEGESCAAAAVKLVHEIEIRSRHGNGRVFNCENLVMDMK